MKQWKIKRRAWQAAILLSLSAIGFQQAQATLSNTNTQSVQALGNGVTTSYTIGFPFQTNDQLRVYSQDESVSPPARTLLQEGAGATKYTVTGGNPGTAVVIGTAPAATARIVIVRQTQQTQKVHYDPDSEFPAASHETAMDKVYQLVQEHEFALQRKVGLSTASTATLPTMPDPAADRFIMFGHDGVSFSTLPVTAAPTVGDTPVFGATGWSTTQALGTLTNQFGAHIANLSNPHQTTAAQVGNTTAQWNANKIQGKTVDTANIGDGKALIYASGADTIGYVAIPGTTGTANYVAAYNGSGVYTPVAGIDAGSQIASGTLGIARGGLGTPVTGASTGVVEFASGLATVRTLVDGDVSASAAIQRGKLKTGNTSQAVFNDSSGNLVTVPALGTSQGGTGVAASGVIYPIAGTVTGMTPNNHGVVISGAASTVTVIAPDASTTKVLTSGGAAADPTWSAVTAPALTVQIKALPYTILSSDGIIEMTNNGNNVNVTFPDATTNSGMVVKVDQKKLVAGQSTLLVTTSGQLFNTGGLYAPGTTTQGLSTFPLQRQGEGAEFYADGSNWRVFNYRQETSIPRIEYGTTGTTCTTGTCLMDTLSPGVTSVTFVSTGVYTVNFRYPWGNGLPTCMANSNNFNQVCGSQAEALAATWNFGCGTAAGPLTAANDRFTFYCIGPK